MTGVEVMMRVMEFPVVDGGELRSPPRVPPRLRRRLTEARTVPFTVDEIEAKLRDADERRQKFYENLSHKARPKPKSPPQSRHEVDLGQRLEAKLLAAELKRSSILARAQLRLAKLDELREAARTGVKLRLRKECTELGRKVESRVKRAECNRMRFRKAYMQRRANLKERILQSLLRRIARESKYKERVRAAISQKRAAAEKKRLGLLEAEKKKAHARLLQVRKVVRSVTQQREVERRRLKQILEDKLQKAKTQRAEYLMLRAGLHSPFGVKWNKQMQKQGEVLSRKLARCWRKFLKQRTTHDLAKAYSALDISERHLKSMPFEHIAVLINSASTLQTTKALLDRLELRCNLMRGVASASSSDANSDINHLLKRVVSPKKRPTPKRSPRGKVTKESIPTQQTSKTMVKFSRYQVRVVLSAYMILGHPDAIFSGQGEREVALANSAENFVREFELLVNLIINGPQLKSDAVSDTPLSRRTFRSQLGAFDASWCSYLNSFVVWKVKDAESLEMDLVRAACQLEISMMQKCKLTPEGDTAALTHDLKAIQKQVTEDQKLLREKVMHLSGNAGLERMQNALSDTRTKYFQAREEGSPVGSPPNGHFLLPSSPSVFSLDKQSNVVDVSGKQSRAVRSLFKTDVSVAPLEEIGASAPTKHSDSQFSDFSGNLDLENEFLVNEFVHGQTYSSASASSTAVEDPILLKVKETMEKAFWDRITESISLQEYDPVVELMREVRDELCEMAPKNWMEEISEAIDLDMLSQLLNTGSLDMDYLGCYLEFALAKLQKLTSIANEKKMKESHDKMLRELAEMCLTGDGSDHSHVIALIKGLRFVLEQIQALKKEISEARIKMTVPLMQGPNGLEYLRKTFAKCHGPPSDATLNLPLTLRWLSSVGPSKDQEWCEHTRALSELRMHDGLSRGLPSIGLRTGRSFPVETNEFQPLNVDLSGRDNQYQECKGEKADLMVRLGLLKLVNEVYGSSQEELPETLKLNFLRLRGVQAQLQKITVIAASILVLRQTLLAEQVVGNPADMESLALKCATQLSQVLDRDDAGLEEIIATLSNIAEDRFKSNDATKAQLRVNLLSRMLRKSVDVGDAVFVRVSRATYLAARGVVLEGTRPQGRELAELALRQVGAAVLTDAVMEAVKELVVAAAVTRSVHGPWYAQLIRNM